MLKIINKQQSVELIKRFVESQFSNETWYQDIKEYLFAIVLYGSVAKETNRVDSDIDVLFILPLEIEQKYTSSEYSYQFEGREVNIVIRSIEKLRKIAAEKNDALQKDVFRDAEIIWNRDGEVMQLLSEIELATVNPSKI